jgi:NAD(P)-dependent dehydrogenase (short-subunit alcohol dehydrogenase family)
MKKLTNSKSMMNKICMVTGATSGIGKQTALGLAAKGATVIIVGRSYKKCMDTVKKIRKTTKNNSIEYILADLSSQKDIHDLSSNFRTKYKSLHVLVNNAGARFLNRQESPDGYEMTFALNHLAYFSLTNLLLHLLEKSAPARIVNVSSGNLAKEINFNDIQAEQHYEGKAAYAQSKLANLMFTYELSRRIKGSGVTSNAVNPGGVATNFSRNNGLKYWLKHILAHTLALNLKGPKEGALASIYLATSPGVKDVTGKFFQNEKEIYYKDFSFDDQVSKKLWDVSEQLTSIGELTK